MGISNIKVFFLALEGFRSYGGLKKAEIYYIKCCFWPVTPKGVKISKIFIK